jgi:hypothetical protein
MDYLLGNLTIMLSPPTIFQPRHQISPPAAPPAMSLTSLRSELTI